LDFVQRDFSTFVTLLIGHRCKNGSVANGLAAPWKGERLKRWVHGQHIKRSAIILSNRWFLARTNVHQLQTPVSG
jgi:hypothetical protein